MINAGMLGDDPMNVFGATATSGAGASDIGVAGSVPINIVNNTSQALIETGASVNANGGDVSLTSLNNSADTTLAFPGPGAQGDTVGIGAAVALNIITNTTQSEIQDGAALTNAGNVTVTASSDQAINTWAQNGAEGGVALGGGIAIVIASSETTARIGADIQTLNASGDLTIGASGSFSVDSLADATANASGAVGLGASVVVNVSQDSFLAELGRNVSAGGAVSITDDATASSQAAAIASEKGADPTGTDSSSGSSGTADQETQNQSNYAHGEGGTNSPNVSGPPKANDQMGSPSGKAKGKSGGEGGDTKVGIAAAVAVNVLTTSTVAKIDDGLTVTAGGTLTVGTTNQSSALALADGRADTNKLSIGAAVSLNVATVTNTATIGSGDTISADGVSVTAIMTSGQVNDVSTQAIGVAIGSQAGVAGSVGINVITINTQASIGAGTIVKSFGDLTVQAANDETLQNVAFTLAVGDDVGAGGAVNVNVLNNPTNAFLDSSVQANVAGMTRITATSSLNPSQDPIPSTPAETIIATGNLEEGDNEVSGINGSINNILGRRSNSPKEGEFVTGTGIPAGTFVLKYEETDFEGVLTFGSDEIVLDLRTALHLNLDRPDLGDSDPFHPKLRVGDTLGGPGIPGGATITNIEFDPLHGAKVTISAPLSVNGSASLAAFVMKLSSNATVSGPVDIIALDVENLLTDQLTALHPTNFAAGIADSSEGAAIAGSFIVNVINQTTHAFINNGAQINTRVGTAGYPPANADEGVTVSATQTMNIEDWAGGIAIGKSVSIGAAVEVNIITEDDLAYIAPNATVDALQNVSVVASTDGSLSIHAVGGAASAPSGGGGSGGGSGGGGSGGSGGSGGGGSSTAIAVGFTAAVNDIANDVSAYLDNATVRATHGNVEIAATAGGTINAISVPVSVAVSGGKSSSGVSISGGGAISLNDVLTNVNAYGQDSSIVAGNAVTLNAEDDTQINSTVVTISVSASGGQGNSTSASLGAAFSENLIGYNLDGSAAPLEVRAYLDNTSVSAGGALILNASTAGMQINSTVVAGVVAVSGGLKNSFSLGGSGVYADNQVALDVEAYLSNIATPVSAASVAISASDTSIISAYAGSASLAASVGKSGATISIGLSLATNQIDNVVQAYIANATGVTTTTGGISLTATESATIDAVSAAASLAIAGGLGGSGVAVSGAGAEATNTILGTDNAYVSASNLKSAGSITLDAEDASQINATIIAAAVSLGISASGSAVGASIGVSVARNFIGYGTNTAYQADHLASDNVLTLNPGDTVKIDAGARAGDVYQYLGQQPITFPYNYTAGTDHPTQVKPGQNVKVPAGTDGATSDSVYQYVGAAPLMSPDLTTQDYADPTMWHQITALQQDYSNPALWRQINVTSGPLQVEAYVANSGVNAATTYTLTADSNQTINALVLALSVAVAASTGTGISVSGSGVYAANQIATDVQAYQDGDGSGPGAGVKATSVSFSATDTSSITANAAAASLAASLSGGAAVSVAIGISVALNQIDNDVEAYIANATTGVTTTSGNISLASKEDATIDATSTAASLAASFAGGVAVGISGAGADATNDILGKDNAYASDSKLTSKADITFTTEDKSTIDAIIVAAAISVAVSGNTGVGASIGAAVAENFIGYDQDGNYLPLQVEAYAMNTSIQATGAYTLTATSQQTINAITTAGSVAVAGGATGAGALSGSGVFTQNMIAANVQAYHDGDGTGTGAGIHAASVAFTTTDGGGNYDLLLLSWGDGSGVPTSGKNLVIVGTDNSGLLHIRIFDANSNLITDTDETQLFNASSSAGLPAELALIATLKAELPSLLPPNLTAGTDHPSQVNPGDRVKVPADIDGMTTDSVFRYVGSSPLTGNPDLTAQNYGDTSRWLRNIPVTAGDKAQVIAEATSIAGQASSQITSIAAAVSVSAALSGTVSIAVSLGVSLATNQIDNDVQAYITHVATGVTTTSGGISVTATESAKITAVSAAAALAAAGSLTVGVAISGAGAEATNTILGTDNAYVSGSNLKSAAGVGLDALDTSQITSYIIAAAVSLGIGVGAGGVGASIGVSVARNFIGNSVDTSAPYDHLTSDNVLTLNPGDTVKIASGARAGDIYQYLGPHYTAGTDHPAQIDPGTRVKVPAGIDGMTTDSTFQFVGKSPLTGSPNLTAQNYGDTTHWQKLTSFTVPFNFTAGTDHPGQVKAGQNVEVPAGTDGVSSESVYQYVGKNSVNVSDLTTQNYSNPALWQQVTALEQDYSDPSLWRQVNVASNPLQVEAYVVSSGVEATGGNYTVTADSNQSINALVLALSAAVGGGTGVGGAVAGSGVYAGNLIATDVLAYHDGGIGTGAGIKAATVSISASDTSTIDANAGAVALSVSLSGGLSISVSIGLSIAMNTIDNDVEAYIAHASQGVTTTSGDTAGLSSVSVSSAENANIQSLSAAASLAVAGSLGVGVAIAGAGADATNVILGRDNASISGSTVTSAGGVSITTQDVSSIEANIISAAASLGVGIGAGGAGAVSIGAAVAENFVGYNGDGTPGSLQVMAYDQGSGISATNDLTISATSNQTIAATVAAASVALAGTAELGGVALAAAGAGVYSENFIGATVKADIDGDGATGIAANHVTVTATDQSAITANAESAAVAVSVAPIGVGVSVAVAVTIASNTISNDVEASIANAAAPVTARIGDLDIGATETASITSTAAAAAAAATIAVGGAFSAAGVSSTNTITTQIDAFIANSADVEAAGAVQVSAGDTPTVSAKIVAAAASAGIVAAAAGIALAENSEGETVAAYIDGSSVKADGANLSVQAASNPSITTTCVAVAIAAGLGFSGAGAESDLMIDTTTQAYVNDATLTASGNVLVGATSTSTAAPTVASAAGGTVALAILVSEATIAGTTTAYAGGQTTVSALAFDIQATGSNVATPKSTVAGAGGITGAGASSTATISQDTTASIAAGANIAAGNTPVNVIALTPTNHAQGQVVTVNVGGIDIAVVSNTADAGGSTSAYVAGSLTAGALTAQATTTSNSADANTVLTGIGAISGGGLIDTARTTATTSAYLAAGGQATLTHSASFTATTATNQATAEATGVSIGVASAQVIDVEANAGGTTDAYVAGTLTGSTLKLSATSTNIATPNTTTVSVGGGLVTVSHTVATIAQTTDARLKSGADVTLGGAATFTATSTSTPTAHTSGVNVGLGTGAAETVTTNLGGSTTTGSDSGVTLHGTSLTATATSHDSSAGHTNVSASFVSVSLLGGSGVTLSSNVTQDTDASLGGTIVLSGAANLGATSTTYSTATNDNVAAGGLNISVLNIAANLGGSTTAGVLANGQLTAASLSVTANGTTTASASDSFVGVAGLGINVVSLSASDTPAVQASLGANSNVTTQQGITVGATSNDNVSASATGVQAGGVAVGATLATATMTPTVNAFIGSGAQVTSAHGAVTVQATEATTNGARASGSVTGVAAGTGEGANIKATAAAQVTSYIGSGATVLAPGNVTVTAAGTNLAEADANTLSVGIVLNVAAIFATATASGVDSAYVGAAPGTSGAGAVVGTAAQQAGGLDVEAVGVDQSTANVNLSGGGAFSGAGGNATANTTPTLNASLSSGSNVNVTGNVAVQATSTTEGHANTDGTSGGIIDVNESLANVTVTPTINTSIGSNTSIVAGGNITVASLHGKSPTQVTDGSFTPAQVSNNTITFAPLNHGLLTGATVTYAQNGNSAIGGLNNGRVSPVIALNPSTLELGAAFNAATVNLANDTITFPGPDDLQTGDKVIYENSGGTPVGGLTPGNLYLVRVIDPQTIKLVDPALGLKTPTSFTPAGTVSSDTIHLPGFSNGQAVTYRAPLPLEVITQDVSHSIINLGTDAKGNPIPDNFTSGQAVVYSLAPGATPIGGLTPGTTYYVITVATNQFQLAATPGGSARTLDTTNTTGGQFFGAVNQQAIGGLVDGNTYYVVNATATSFQLALTRGGSAQTLAARGIVGAHTIGVEGIDFTTAGTGTQDLVFPLNTAGASGTYRLVGVGGAGALLNAPPGDGEAIAGAISSGGGLVQVGGASASVVSKPTVATSVGGGTSLTANGDVTITSTSYANASADGSNSGGGFVGVGSGMASVTTDNNNNATLGTGDVIDTLGDFTLQATSYHNVLASSDSSGGGAIVHAGASTTATTSDQAAAQVGASSQITAGGNILIQSSEGVTEYSNAYANGGGLGVDTDATATTQGTAQATTTIQGSARLDAGELAGPGLPGPRRQLDGQRDGQGQRVRGSQRRQHLRHAGL